MDNTPVSSAAQSWRRIDAWLALHAPATAAALRGPATDAEIRMSEQALGIDFPPDLIDSLRCHNGLHEWAYQGGESVLPFTPPLGTNEIVEQWRLRMEVAQTEGILNRPRPTEADEPWWHTLWIPYAAADGYMQIIDMRPGDRQGQVGEADNVDVDFDDAWPTLGAYLEAVVTALDIGTPVNQFWHPFITDDNNLYWGSQTDTDLNGAPRRPAPLGIPPLP